MKIKFLINILVITLVILLPSMIFMISTNYFNNTTTPYIWNEINRNLSQIFTKDEVLKLDRWNVYYNMGDYKNAVSVYRLIDCDDLSLENCFILNHNIWNAYYRLWDLGGVLLSDRVAYWTNAIDFYLRALKIRDDEETEANYDFVMEKLKKIYDENSRELEVTDDIIERWEILKDKIWDILDNL